MLKIDNLLETRLDRLQFFKFNLVILIVLSLIPYTPFVSGITICVFYSLFIRRINDIGISRWWVLLFLLPGPNIIFWIYLFFKKGHCY